MKRTYLLAAALFFSAMALQAQHHHADTGQMTQQQFEDLVKNLEKPTRNSWQKPEDVMNLVRPLKNRKVMDLGCGTGYFSFRMIDSGATVIAADIDDRLLAYVDSVRNARGVSKKQLQTRKVAPDNPMLDKREVDMVLIVNTYHHFTNRVEYMRKVKNGLKTGGFVLIIDFFKKDIPMGPPVEQKLSADEITRELKMAGFSQFKTDDKTLPFQYILFAL
jgi:SAM-dependent methyltransferase